MGEARKCLRHTRYCTLFASAGRRRDGIEQETDTTAKGRWATTARLDRDTYRRTTALGFQHADRLEKLFKGDIDGKNERCDEEGRADHDIRRCDDVLAG